MKIETAVITTKGFCVVTRGVCIALTAGLAQWAVGGEEPSRIGWVVIVTAAILGGANDLSAFLSTSFASYLHETKQPVEPAPTTPTPPTP